MEPSYHRAPFAPPRIPPTVHQKGSSVMSPTDLSSGPSGSPQIPFVGPWQFSPSLRTMPENDVPMEVDEIGYPKPPLENHGPSATGGNPKGQSPKTFLDKLLQMLADPEAAAYIQWSHDGREFVVTNHEEFPKKVLSKYFRHDDFDKFVQRLNVHEFYKAQRSQKGTNQPQIWIFSHPGFQRDRPDLRHGIKPPGKKKSTAPLPSRNDQRPGERRPSLSSSVAGIRSPPGGAMNQGAMILGLQRKNEGLDQSILQMGGSYKELERDRIQPRPQSQQFLDSREPARAGIMADNSTHVPHFDNNSRFQQDGLTSPPTDSQSAVDKFRSAGPTNPFVSASSVSKSSGITRSSSTNPLHNTLFSISPTVEQVLNDGPSGYPEPVQHQSNPISPYKDTFQGTGSFGDRDFEPPQVAGRPGQNFPSAVSQTPTYLGARPHSGMTRSGNAGLFRSGPFKSQPPKSTGGLYR